MQSEEREGSGGHGCGGGWGHACAQEPTDLNAAAERVFEQLRLLAEKSEVIVRCCLPWLALVRLMRMCARLQ